jgi:hypothetical protein
VEKQKESLLGTKCFSNALSEIKISITSRQLANPPALFLIFFCTIGGGDLEVFVLLRLFS